MPTETAVLSDSPENKVREMGRMSTGVRGMTLDGDEDEVVGMICMNADTTNNVMVISEKGYGKRSPLEDYRVTNRGGKGCKDYKRYRKDR